MVLFCDFVVFVFVGEVFVLDVCYVEYVEFGEYFVEFGVFFDLCV